MPTLAIALSGDRAGGAVTATATRMFVNARAVVRFGDPVESHGEPPHAAATMATATAGLIVEGKSVCRMGDTATCGHAITATATTCFSG